ncbi:MAG: DUF3108 domain-containing protein [Gemmatimonadota bacterium]
MSGRDRFPVAVLSGALLLGSLLPMFGAGLHAQGGAEEADDAAEPVVIPWAAEVPFGPGERLEYDVKMGAFSVGEGVLAVEDVDTIRGHPSYHVSMSLAGGIPLARVDDYFQSWLDTELLVSRRFHQQIREAGYESDRHYEILSEEGRWERTDVDDGGEMITNFPLDDISFVYYVRTLDLTPGKEYRFDRYFKEDGNPVVVQVVGNDRIEVPAGTFETVVVRPVIQTDGLFGEGGEAELHFTDDENHYLVYMRVKIPLIRSMTLHLQEIREGREVLASTPGDEEDLGAEIDE